MKINPKSFIYEDVVKLLENPFIQSLEPLEYGKAIQTAVEHYVTHQVNSIAKSELLVDLTKNAILSKSFEYGNNGPGFDRLLQGNQKKIQIKLRQVYGVTPYTRQVHFENTRRQSEKNKNESSESGLVRYAVNEFDYVVVVLCHIIDGERKKYHDWSYSVIKTYDLEDVNIQGYCTRNISSALLMENKCDNIYMLTNKLKGLI